MSSPALALFLVAPAAVHAAAPQPQDAETQVRAAITAMNTAAAELDADRFMAWYWNSPSLMITFDDETLQGWQVILEQQREWWSDRSSGVQYAEERPAVVRVQSADVVTTIQWMTVKDGQDAVLTRLVVTSVWKKLPEGWRIVLAHETLDT